MKYSDICHASGGGVRFFFLLFSPEEGRRGELREERGVTSPSTSPKPKLIGGILHAASRPTACLVFQPVHGLQTGHTHHDDPRCPRRAPVLGHGPHVGKTKYAGHLRRGLHGFPTRCAKKKHFLKHEERLSGRTIKTRATFPLEFVLSDLQGDLSTRVNHSPTTLLRLLCSQRNHLRESSR